MKLGENLPLSISGTGSFICPVTQSRLDIPSPLFTQSWTTGGSQGCLARVRLERPTCRSTVDHANHQTTTTAVHLTADPPAACIELSLEVNNATTRTYPGRIPTVVSLYARLQPTPSLSGGPTTDGTLQSIRKPPL